jgi:cytochrome P450 PksS
MAVLDTKNEYQIWGVAARRDPHALYAKLRRERPVYRAIGPVSGNTFWFVTRYEDCATLLRDPRFGKEFRRSQTPEQLAQLPPPDEALSVIDSHMLNFDLPDHTRLRSLVHKAFTPTMIENLRGRIYEIADALLDDIAKSGDSRIDLVESYAFPLPIIVIAELLGIPPQDRAQFRRWTRDIVFGSDMNEMRRAVIELLMYLQPIFEARRKAPQDDLISALLAVEESGDRLSPNELTSMIFLLLVAGHETTVNLIANGTLALLEWPDELEKLRADGNLIKPAIEEMLRYNGPIENTLSRWAYEDTELGGQVIRRGDNVMATVLSANRDPDVFPDPDRFDITRTPNKHLAFGGGIHYCLGAPLARLEGAIAIEMLLKHFPNLSLAVPPSELQWNEQIIFRSLLRLPLIVG